MAFIEQSVMPQEDDLLARVIREDILHEGVQQWDFHILQFRLHYLKVEYVNCAILDCHMRMEQTISRDIVIVDAAGQDDVPVREVLG